MRWLTLTPAELEIAPEAVPTLTSTDEQSAPSRAVLLRSKMDDARE